jgi:hypothetical protein
MIDEVQYAVYLHPGAVEALGEAIKPYLTQGAHGPHILCKDLDTGGALCEMTVQTQTPEGVKQQTEVMLPVAMVQLVLSVGGIADSFGFHTPA